MIGLHKKLTRQQEIRKLINSQLTQLGRGEIIEVRDLGESEMNTFVREYDNDTYEVIGSAVDYENMESGDLRYCFSLMRRNQNA